MAMQRGIRPQMPIGKLKAPGVFGQQEKPAEPSWRAGLNKSGANKTATATTVVSKTSPETVPAASATPSAVSPTAVPVKPASDALGSNISPASTGVSETAPPASNGTPSSVPPPQAGAAASPSAPATTPAPPAANKVNLSKFQQVPKVATVTPKPIVAPAPSPVAAASTAPVAPVDTTPPPVTAATRAPVATKFSPVTAPVEASSITPTTVKVAPSPAAAPVPATNKSNLTKTPTVNGTKSSDAAPRIVGVPTTTSAKSSSPSSATTSQAKSGSTVSVQVAPDTIVPASVQTAQSSPVSTSTTPVAVQQPVTTPSADDRKLKSPPVVVLDPTSELLFRGSFSDGLTTHFRLTNKSADSRVCFKVKTNVPPFYSVHPSIDLIEPLQHVDVTVCLQATSSGRPDADGQHKFMVQSIHAPDGEITSLDRLWQQARPNEIASAKLVCVFEEIKQSPPPSSSSVFEDMETRQSQPLTRSSRTVDDIETSWATPEKTRDAKSKKSTKSQSLSPANTVWMLLLAVVVALIAFAVYKTSK